MLSTARDEGLAPQRVILRNLAGHAPHLDLLLLLLLLQQRRVFGSHHLLPGGDAEAGLHHRRHAHVAPRLRLIGLHLARVPQIDERRVSGMDEAVDGAVGRGLQRVVGAVQLENTARARESEAARRWVTASNEMAPQKKLLKYVRIFNFCSNFLPNVKTKCNVS